MKLYGQELKYNGSDVWHAGNFDPAAKANLSHGHLPADLPTVDETSRKVLTGSVSAAGYFAFAQTPVNPVDWSAILKITVASPVNATIAHVLYVFVHGHANTVPMIQVITKTNNGTAATTGLYYLRGVYPKTVGNGYRSLLEFYTYNATQRDIVIELLDARNIELLPSLTASPYNSTYQSVTTPAVLYNGIVTNGTLYGSLSGNANSASYLYNASFAAGEALAANDIIFLSGSNNRWYKVNVADRSIPIGTVLARCAGAYSVGSTVGAYLQGYFNLPTALGTIVAYKDLFVRGQVSGGAFVSDGTVTTETAAGYSFMRIGSVINSTAYANYDGNNRVYTLGAGGKLSALDTLGLEVPTKLSQLENDIGAGAGLVIIPSSSEPAGLATGDWWYKEV